MLFGAVAALLLLYVAEQAVVISLTYRLTDVKAEVHAADVETDRLQLQMSELSSPARIEKVAREDLHLVPGNHPAYLAEAPAVAMVPPAGEDGQGTVIARLQRWFRGSLAEAHAAQ
jgi:cell division protein FtsL